jgi:peptidoglycan/xylan/chitin deacetylase (PgdA/CDA1 family)
VKQLDYLENEYGFISKDEFQECISSTKPKKGVILTFDDGFKDHYRYVLPELMKRSLWGIFYISTSPLFTGKLIDVHRIHMLLGKYGGIAIADALRGVINEDMLSHAHVKEFTTETYKRWNDSESTNYVKRLLNYFIDYRYRQSVIDELMSSYFPNETDLVKSFYMTKTELEDMYCKGMVLGSHTVNHPVMSKLTKEEQYREITSSLEMIESITGKAELKTYCHPYGGFHTFTAQTEELLDQNSCLFSFNVESRPINQKDLANRLQALPRFDCNEFPYGSFRNIKAYTNA